MEKRTFIANVFKMSFAMLAANLSGMCYSIYISSMAGAEAIGVFHLVMSVFSLATVISLSGITLTVTRLISDSNGKNTGNTVARCMAVCAVTSCSCAMAMYVMSDYIAEAVLKMPECTLSIRLLSPALVCIAISGVITGCFTATGKIGSVAFSKIAGELTVWGATIITAEHFAGKEYNAIAVAMAISAATECMCNIILYIKSFHTCIYSTGKTPYRKILRLCAPIAVGSYLRTGLSSAENIMIPQKLTLYGQNNPLAQYGIIKGMSIPVMMFPSVFTNAFSSLIVPEIARRRSMGMKNSIRYISALSVEYILKFAFMISTIYAVYHSDICNMFYNEKNAGVYLGMLCMLPVLMFADTAIDSVLKGLDLQVSSLKINIADSVCRVLFVAVFVPQYGIMAYVVMLYLSELINIIFSYRLLKRACRLKFPFAAAVVHPLIAATASTCIAKKIFPYNFISGIFAFCTAFVLLVILLKKLTKHK